MYIKEAKLHRPHGDMGCHEPPYRIRGHVQMSISPFRQRIMQGFVSDFVKRIVVNGPNKVASFVPAAIFLFGIKFYHDRVLNSEHSKKYN